jgi:dTDP-glucose pyrophosphorylase
MAGAGSRFSKVGYADPKPLIQIHGKPMIQIVVENLTPTRDHKFVFICQKTHIEKYNLEHLLGSIAPGSEIVIVEGLTRGAAETVMFAANALDMKQPLMIANSDQYLDAKIDDYLERADDSSLDGLIMTMWADDPKWSYVRLNSEDLITDIREKEVISNDATVGIYNFRTAESFFKAAEEMINANALSNGEYYVAPVYQYLIRDGKRIGVSRVPSGKQVMFGLGTPEDLNFFLSSGLNVK